MKAICRPPKAVTPYMKDVRMHIKNDLDAYLESKEKTIQDRVFAVVCVTLNDTFSFGTKRLQRFWDAFQKEIQRQIRNKDDTGDDMLFLELNRIGMEKLVKTICDDYAAEKEAIKDTIFDIGENE